MRRFYQRPGWLFAGCVFVLLLACYGVVRIIGTLTSPRLDGIGELVALLFVPLALAFAAALLGMNDTLNAMEQRRAWKRHTHSKSTRPSTEGNKP